MKLNLDGSKQIFWLWYLRQCSVVSQSTLHLWRRQPGTVADQLRHEVGDDEGDDPVADSVRGRDQHGRRVQDVGARRHWAVRHRAQDAEDILRQSDQAAREGVESVQEGQQAFAALTARVQFVWVPAARVGLPEAPERDHGRVL